MKKGFKDIYKVLVPIANGTEEIEVVTIIDTLIRAGSNVTIASIENNLQVTCSRGVQIVANAYINNCISNEYDLICLPGGMPGSIRLKENKILKDLVINHVNQSKLIGAICAAPSIVLNNYGILQGKTVTCYPSSQFRDNLQNSSVSISNQRVVVDNNIITSQGPGTALEFSLTLVELLYGKEFANELGNQMIYQKVQDK